MPHKEFKFSGTGAVNYDRYLGPILFEPAASQMVSFFDRGERTDAILEIAGGTGRLTRHLLNRFPPPARLVATDLNSDMLDIAKQRINNEAVEFSTEDAQDLSFADNSFDLAVCQFGLMFFPDKFKAAKEAFRVLRRGGRCFFSTWERVEFVPMFKLIYNDVLLASVNDSDPARFLTPFSLYDPGLLQRLMQDAGFKNCQVGRVEFQSGVTDAETIVKGFFSEHSVGAEISRTDPELFQKIEEKMVAEIVRTFGDGQFSFGLVAHLVSGNKE